MFMCVLLFGGVVKVSLGWCCGCLLLGGNNLDVIVVFGGKYVGGRGGRVRELVFFFFLVDVIVVGVLVRSGLLVVEI